MQCRCHSFGVLLPFVAIALAACAKPSAPEATEPEVVVTAPSTVVDPANYELNVPASLAQGSNAPIEVLAKNGAAAPTEITWSVKEGGAGQVRIASDGNSTVVTADVAGDVTLVASIVVDTQRISLEVKVTVGPPVANPTLVINAPDTVIKGLDAPVSVHIEGFPASLIATWSIETGSQGTATFSQQGATTLLSVGTAGDVTLVATAIVNDVELKARRLVHLLAAQKVLITLRTNPPYHVGDTLQVRAELMLSNDQVFSGAVRWGWELVNEPANTTSLITPTTGGDADVKLGHRGTITIRATARYGAPEIVLQGPPVDIHPIEAVMTGISLDGVYHALLTIGERVNVFVRAIYSDGTSRIAAQWQVNDQPATASGDNSLNIVATAGDTAKGLTVTASVNGFTARETLMVESPQALDATAALAGTAMLNMKTSNGKTGSSSRWQRSFDIPVGGAGTDFTVVADLNELAGRQYQFEIATAPSAGNYLQASVCQNAGPELAKIGCGAVADAGGVVHGNIFVIGQIDSNPLDLPLKVYRGRYSSEGSYDPISNKLTAIPIFTGGNSVYYGQVMTNQADASHSVSFYDATFEASAAGAKKIAYTLVQTAPLSAGDTISMEIFETTDMTGAKCGAQLPVAVSAQAKAVTCVANLVLAGSGTKHVYIRVDGLPEGGGANAAGGARFCLYQQDPGATLPTTCSAPSLLQ